MKGYGMYFLECSCNSLHLAKTDRKIGLTDRSS